MTLRRTLSCALLAGACGGTAPTPEFDPTSPARREIVPLRDDPSEPSVSDAGATDPSAIAEGVVARSLARVSSVRSLLAKGPVKARVVTRAEMLALISEKLKTDIPADVMTAHRELLVLLGAVPLDFDFEADLMRLMGSQLAGFYEPEDDTMVLASDLGGPEGKATLAHELVHALQDQHYDLGAKIRFVTDGSDRQSAMHALAEGDAMSAMLDDMFAELGRTALDMPDALLATQVRASMSLDAATASVPDVIKSSLVAPYIDGTIFVHALRRRGGWAEVDRVWHSPPTTTEQVLHVEKLYAGEGAITVPIPNSPGPAFSTLYHDVFGEQSLAITFDEWLPRAPSESAAAGWGGDRIAVFRKEREFAMAWRIDFDSETEAKEAHEIVGKALGAACVERDGRGPLAFGRRQRAIAFVAGPYASEGLTSRSAGTCKESQAWLRRVLAQK